MTDISDFVQQSRDFIAPENLEMEKQPVI